MKFKGTVIKGHAVGEKFGVSTANLEVQKLPVLEHGVYLVWAFLGGKKLPAIMHFGNRQTFGSGFSVEVHLLNFSGDLYGKELEVESIKKVREIQQFENSDALFTQIEKDIVQARKYFLRQEIYRHWEEGTDSQRKTLVQKALWEVGGLKEFEAAQTVLVFAPDKYEIPFVQPMMSAHPEKTYCFPRVDGGQMQFYASKWEELQSGKRGILGPVEGQAVDLSTVGFAFIPAVAADDAGNRLGRGGGNYDRILEQINCTKVVILPKFAQIKSLPKEAHDVLVNQVFFV